MLHSFFVDITGRKNVEICGKYGIIFLYVVCDSLRSAPPRVERGGGEENGGIRVEYDTIHIMGVIQGIAEFLPISSSGHLVLFETFFGMKESESMLFTVLLHLGTLVSGRIYYRKDVWEMPRAFGTWVTASSSGTKGDGTSHAGWAHGLSAGDGHPAALCPPADPWMAGADLFPQHLGLHRHAHGIPAVLLGPAGEDIRAPRAPRWQTPFWLAPPRPLAPSRASPAPALPFPQGFSGALT